MTDQSKPKVTPLNHQWACCVGVNEALFLQQLKFLLEGDKGKIADGQKWYRETLDDWVEYHFPYWDRGILKRTIRNLKGDKLVLARHDLNSMNIDRTSWYSIDFDQLNNLTEPVERLQKKSKNRQKARENRPITTRKVQSVPMEDKGIKVPSVQSVPLDLPIGTKCTDAKVQSVPDNNHRDSKHRITTSLNREVSPKKINPKLKLLFDKATAQGIDIPELSPGIKRQFIARSKYLNGSTGLAIDQAINEDCKTVPDIIDFVAKWSPPPEAFYFDEAGKPTSKHPAIQTFKANMHRYPAKNVYPEIAEAVGVNPDRVEFWGKVVKTWKLLPFRPNNYVGMLECFQDNRLPSVERTSNHAKNQGYINRSETIRPTQTRPATNGPQPTERTGPNPISLEEAFWAKSKAGRDST